MNEINRPEGCRCNVVHAGFHEVGLNYSDDCPVHALVDGKVVEWREHEPIDPARLTLAALETSLSDLERWVSLLTAHSENLIQRMAEVEERLGYGVTGSTMVKCDNPLCRDGMIYDDPYGEPCPRCEGLGAIWIPPWKEMP